MKFRKIILTLMSTLIVTSSVAGCSTGKNTKNTSSQDSIPELTYFVWFAPLGQANINSRSDTELYKEIERKINVKIKFIHPPAGQEKEKFNLMLASNELPDMIENNWLEGISGGVESMLKDGKLLTLNDTINKYAPNLKKYLDEHSDVEKMIKTDDGKQYAFPFLRGDPILCVNYGAVIRKDWLDDLGMSIPETIDEWYAVLKAFKEKKGASAPFSFIGKNNNDQQDDLYRSNAFVGAYGTSKKFFIENGKVVYGPTKPEYKEFLKTFQKWYNEGLLEKDFAVIDRKTFDARVLSGQTGAFLGYPGSHIGTYLDSMNGKDSKFDLVAVPNPVLHKGDKPKLGNYNNMYFGHGSVAITSKCKNVEAAAKFLDFGYSEEGHRLFNFGIEGKSYKMENGKPVFTDEILKNPNGLTTNQAMSIYMRAQEQGPFVQDKDYIYQYYKYPQQKKALEIWSDTEASKYELPPLMYTQEESKKRQAIMTEIDTYSNEMFYKFVMGGIEPLDNYDKYVDQLNKLGVKEVTEINQKALERYKNR